MLIILHTNLKSFGGDNNVSSHSTTLIKLTKKYGEEIIAELNQTLVQKAQEKKIIRGRKLQMDTIVIKANIHHPTDASLLADYQKTITRTVKKIKEQGFSLRTKLQDRKRSIKKDILRIAKVLNKRSDHKHEQVRGITETIAYKVEATIVEGRKVLQNARQKLWRLTKEKVKLLNSIPKSSLINLRINCNWPRQSSTKAEKLALKRKSKIAS